MCVYKYLYMYVYYMHFSEAGQSYNWKVTLGIRTNYQSLQYVWIVILISSTKVLFSSNKVFYYIIFLISSNKVFDQYVQNTS